MKEITEQNYKQLEYNWGGIIIAYPRVALYFNADFYFIKQKINYDTDERTYFYSGVNKEDEVSELSPDWHKKDFESCFGNWNEIKYYQFENIDEFCNWYVHKDDKIKESIDKFIKETKEFEEKQHFHTVELDSILGTNHVENIERKKKVCYFEQKYGFNPYKEEVPEELSYWEIYNDENCDNELKRIIEKKCPEIKELASIDAKIIKNKISCNYTFDEIRDKMEPGWDTRRAQLQDVLKLLELRDMKQNTLEMLTDKMDDSKREYLLKQLERDEQRIEDFLNEKVL